MRQLVISLPMLPPSYPDLLCSNPTVHCASFKLSWFKCISHMASFDIHWLIIIRFMPADAYWTMAMACNVFLTFYYKFGAEQLRRLEIYYLILCYGVPLIPAFVFIFIKTQRKGSIYGNATLWCWVADDWDILRIAVFYGPVWYVNLSQSDQHD